MRTFEAGTLAGAGSFKCEECGYAVALHERDEVPACPSCGGDSFRRASPVRRDRVRRGARGRERRGGVAATRRATRWWPTATTWRSTPATACRWCRSRTAGPGSAAASRRTCAWTTRRSRAATRSIYRDDDGAKVLDDRSLNGVFRNGERVDLAELEDGDTVAVGRFTLHFISLSGTGGGAPMTDPAEGALA